MLGDPQNADVSEPLQEGPLWGAGVDKCFLVMGVGITVVMRLHDHVVRKLDGATCYSLSHASRF